MSTIWFLVPLPFLSLYIWKFSIHVLLKATLKDFEHNLVSMWNETQFIYSSLNIVWHCPSLGLIWKLILSSSVATAEFSRFAGILSAAVYQHHLLRFEFSSAGIPSPSLVLFLVMLPKTHLTLYLTHFYTPDGAWKCPALTGWSFKMSQIKLTVIFYWKWWWLKIKKISWSISRLEYSVGSHPYESLVTRSIPGINYLRLISREETPDTLSFPLNW